MIETLRTFNALSEEFVELYFKHDPVAATLAGVHDYDHKLPDHSSEGWLARIAWLRDLDQRLVLGVAWQELPTEQRVEYGALRARIAAMRADCEEIRVQSRNPVLFPQTALDALFLLWTRPALPAQERKEALLDRMIAVPDYLKAARANLKQVPDVYLTVADEVNRSGPGFVDQIARSLYESFPAERERIEHAAGRARIGFAQYQDFLDRELESKVGGTFAIGERWMNYKLEREHLLGMDCAALRALGEEHVAKTREMLEAEAKRIDPAKPWQEQIAAAKQRVPDAQKLKDLYQAETARARRFVEERRLAPIAPGEKLAVIDTPVFERAMIPYAAYLAPGPFDEDQTGHFYVTPIDATRRAEEQRQQLEGHNLAGLALTAVHEAYPGHHLQLCHANRAGSRLRRLGDSTLLAEGWALYCEEMMHEQGFYEDPLTRLYQLKDLLWRACRVVLDVGLHTGATTFMQAVDVLREQALLERVNAIGEVRRYTMTPTQPMSYLVGKLAILAMRDEAKARLGARFDLFRFHETLLGRGTLPTALVAEELTELLT
ncbi:MAG: DUF885 domain-containing protein [Candidatus Eisenbacteria bacterium]|uniref:DUF885 domain-containing protein n=1 Tax=Eiseniibacteriota bacterium TaxID=2212470 RepID=A0A9D6QJL4_UNCEI|nr:DUF885 domain-containing protein [Candidatus Eisenbacteria bacterium]